MLCLLLDTCLGEASFFSGKVCPLYQAKERSPGLPALQSAFTSPSEARLQEIQQGSVMYQEEPGCWGQKGSGSPSSSLNLTHIHWGQHYGKGGKQQMWERHGKINWSTQDFDDDHSLLWGTISKQTYRMLYKFRDGGMHRSSGGMPRPA